MSLLFMESFDHYTAGFAELTRKWSSIFNTSGVSVGSSYGRNSTNGLRLTTSGIIEKFVGTQTTLVAGMSINIQSWAVGVSPIFAFKDGSSFQTTLAVNNTGQLRFYRGSESGTLVVTSSNTISLGSANYIEMKVTFGGSGVGAYEIRVNGITWLTASGVNTITTANSSANTLQLNAGTGTIIWYDDLYLLNTSGSVNNNFMGDVRVQCIYPNGAGSNTGFTPNTGTNYGAVDETAPDDDTTYVSSDTPGTKDTYNFQNLSGTATVVYGVQRLALARKDDAGSRSIKLLYRESSTDYESAAMSLGTSYAYSNDIMETNPATTSQWTVNEINGAEFGIKVEA